jgi:hypothetical protein
MGVMVDDGWWMECERTVSKVGELSLFHFPRFGKE